MSPTASKRRRRLRGIGLGISDWHLSPSLRKANTNCSSLVLKSPSRTADFSGVMAKVNERSPWRVPGRRVAGKVARPVRMGVPACSGSGAIDRKMVGFGERARSVRAVGGMRVSVACKLLRERVLCSSTRCGWPFSQSPKASSFPVSSVTESDWRLIRLRWRDASARALLMWAFLNRKSDPAKVAENSTESGCSRSPEKVIAREGERSASISRTMLRAPAIAAREVRSNEAPAESRFLNDPRRETSTL